MIDLKAITGQELLDEMQARSEQAILRIANVLEEYYPGFQREITVCLTDVQARIGDQVIGGRSDPWVYLQGDNNEPTDD